MTTKAHRFDSVAVAASRRLAVLLLLSLVAAPAPSEGDPAGGDGTGDDASPAPPRIEIAEVLRDDDQNTVPDLLDEIVRIRGVVTVPTGLLSEHLHAIVQDAHGGVTLFDFDQRMQLELGMEVDAVGKVSQYRGTVQIVDPNIQILGTRELPAAKQVPLPEAASWRYYGQRVQVAGTTGELEFSSFATVTLRQDQGEITLYVPEKVTRTFPFALLEAGSRIEATGVVSIYKRSWPYDEGFQLIVQSGDDIRLVEPPPPVWHRYLPQMLAVAVTITAISVLLLFVQQRRQRRRRREYAAINAISSAVGSPAAGVADLLAKTADTITEFGIVDAVLLHLFGGDRSPGPQCWSNLDDETAGVFVYDLARRGLNAPPRPQLETISSRADEIRRLVRQRGLHLRMLQPLEGRAGTLGILTGLTRSGSQLSVDQERVLRSAARLVAMGIDHYEIARQSEEVRQELEELAISDDLTGLYNRRFFQEYVRIQGPMTRRRQSHLGLLILDLDHFKVINDTYGHDVGDQVLVRIAEIIGSSTRSSDLPVRWGGEEFLIVLVDSSIQGARTFAERLRRRIGECRMSYLVAEATLQITASIGLALYPQHGDTVEQVLHACDEALYRAKREGRDRVVVHGD